MKNVEIGGWSFERVRLLAVPSLGVISRSESDEESAVSLV